MDERRNTIFTFHPDQDMITQENKHSTCHPDRAMRAEVLVRERKPSVREPIQNLTKNNRRLLEEGISLGVLLSYQRESTVYQCNFPFDKTIASVRISRLRRFAPLGKPRLRKLRFASLRKPRRGLTVCLQTYAEMTHSVIVLRKKGTNQISLPPPLPSYQKLPNPFGFGS